MSLDRALDGVPFRVDLIRCHAAAETLRGWQPTPMPEPWSNQPLIDQLAFKALFISVCHQMNWDVLQNVLAGWLLPNTSNRLEEFQSTRPSQIASLLERYPKKARVRARERAGMLSQTAIALQPLISEGGALARLMQNPVLDGEGGFYDVMSKVPAYTGDPFDKKARVLAHDLYRERILRFSDPKNLRPAVEYHLIRLYLRSGRVYPTNEIIKEVLTGPPRPARRRLVMMLRGTVDEAMRQTALYADLDMATLNYVEWQVARSTCVEELGQDLTEDFCRRSQQPALSEDLRPFMPDGCPFRHVCSSLNDPSYGWFREPQFQTAIY